MTLLIISTKKRQVTSIFQIEFMDCPCSISGTCITLVAYYLMYRLSKEFYLDSKIFLFDNPMHELPFLLLRYTQYCIKSAIVHYLATLQTAIVIHFPYYQKLMRDLN